MNYFKKENWVVMGKDMGGNISVINLQREKIIIHSLLWIAILILFVSQFPFGTVRAGERGVLLQFGAVADKIYKEGLYFRVPIVQKVVRMDVKIQKNEVEVGAASKDLQIVSAIIALNYHLDAERVNILWQEVGKEYDTRIIDPAIQEAVKASTAKFTAEELITKREIVKEEIKLNIIERLEGRNIIVDMVNIVDFDFSPEFNKAIEAKVTAEQQALAAKNKLEQVKFEAQQAVEEAQGKAKAIQIEGDALRSTPQIVELRWIEKWDGKTPLYWGNATPFIGLPQN